MDDVEQIFFRSGGRGFAQPRLIGGESGKISVRRRPWHGGDCFATDGTGSSGSIQFRRKKNDPDDLKDGKHYWTSVYVNSIVLVQHESKSNVKHCRDLRRALATALEGAKISLDDSYTTFLQGLISSWGKDKAIAYLKKRRSRNPSLCAGARCGFKLAAAGEFPLVLAYANIIQNLAERGAPVDWAPLEPAIISVNTVMLGAKAAHPNAGKLLIDFTLSKEGQEKLWDFQRIPSRIDVEPKLPGCFAATSATSSILRIQRSRRSGQIIRSDTQDTLA